MCFRAAEHSTVKFYREGGRRTGKASTQGRERKAIAIDHSVRPLRRRLLQPAAPHCSSSDSPKVSGSDHALSVNPVFATAGSPSPNPPDPPATTLHLLCLPGPLCRTIPPAPKPTMSKTLSSTHCLVTTTPNLWSSTDWPCPSRAPHLPQSPLPR